MGYLKKLPAKKLMIFIASGEVFSHENTLYLQVSLSVLVIKDVTNMSKEATIAVSLGVPLQLFWSILGWLAVSISDVFFLLLYLHLLKGGNK